MKEDDCKDPEPIKHYRQKGDPEKNKEESMEELKNELDRLLIKKQMDKLNAERKNYPDDGMTDPDWEPSPPNISFTSANRPVGMPETAGMSTPECVILINSIKELIAVLDSKLDPIMLPESDHVGQNKTEARSHVIEQLELIAEALEDMIARADL